MRLMLLGTEIHTVSFSRWTISAGHWKSVLERVGTRVPPLHRQP